MEWEEVGGFCGPIIHNHLPRLSHLVRLSKRGRGKGGGRTGRSVGIEYPAFSLPVSENLPQALVFLLRKKKLQVR